MRTIGIKLVAMVTLAWPAAALAGMPAPLPTDYIKKTMVLNDQPLQRLQVISFFLLVFFLSALLLKFNWNYLQRDFSVLPRLNYLKALAAIFLVGVLFVIVLTMISGARELMTPGAWKKDGVTYKLAEESRPEAPSEARRREQMAKLRTALLQFAATHQGRFPTKEEVATIPSELWDIPGAHGLRYIYVPGLSAGNGSQLLAYEPEWESERLVLRVNGEIAMLTKGDLQATLAEGSKP
jgi:hypothetical protein